MSLADLRREYQHASLTEDDVKADPMVQFQVWFAEAELAEVPEPNAMCLATSTRDGAPSARIVLLKAVDARGFVFYTDYRSQKGNELTDNPQAGLCFFWHALERQVRISGSVERVSRAESEEYFQSRPLNSRIGASASHQSAVLESRNALEVRVQELAVQYAHGTVPLPDYWGGFRVIPHVMEFWQGRPSRLHDRIRFLRSNNAWTRQRLSP